MSVCPAGWKPGSDTVRFLCVYSVCVSVYDHRLQYLSVFLLFLHRLSQTLQANSSTLINSTERNVSLHMFVLMTVSEAQNKRRVLINM